MKNSPLFWILKRNSKRIPAMLWMVLAHVGAAVLGVMLTLISRNVIDSAARADAAGFYSACWKLALFVLLLLATQWIGRNMAEQLKGELERDWKKQLFAGLLYGEYEQVSGYHSAELMNRLNNDVRIVNEGLLQVLPNGSAMVAKLVAAAAVLGVLDWRLTAILLGIGLIAFPATGIFRKKLKQLHRQVSQQDGKVSGLLQEALEKLLVVQAMDLSVEIQQRADGLLDDRYDAFTQRKNQSLAGRTAVNVLYHGTRLLALVWCARRLLLGQMSVGTLSAVTALVGQLRSPMTNLSGVIPQYVAMAASAERLKEIWDIRGKAETETVPVQSTYDALLQIKGEGLTFSYDREQVLENAEFSVGKGEFVVLTGQSGIGKSTLLKLMLRIFPLKKGRLYLDTGKGHVPLGVNTRRMFAYVPQGNLVLSGTLRENLLLVCPDASEQDIRNATYISCMDDYLAQLPNGLDTMLAENGAGLSEGQIQRLAIARAVLSEAPILLLDECTSALDVETERLVLSRIKAMGRTCIAVSHRNAALELCDRVLEFRDGKIYSV